MTKHNNLPIQPNLFDEIHEATKDMTTQEDIGHGGYAEPDPEVNRKIDSLLGRNSAEEPSAEDSQSNSPDASSVSFSGNSDPDAPRQLFNDANLLSAQEKADNQHYLGLIRGAIESGKNLAEIEFPSPKHPSDQPKPD